MVQRTTPKALLKLAAASVGLLLSRLIVASTVNSRRIDLPLQDIRLPSETEDLLNRLQSEIAQLRIDWTDVFLQSGPLNADAITRKAEYLDLLDRRIEDLRKLSAKAALPDGQYVDAGKAPSQGQMGALQVRADAMVKAVAKQHDDLNNLRRARSAR